MNNHADYDPDIREVMRSIAGSMVGAVTVACIIAGHRTGLYQAMSNKGACSADEIVSLAGTNQRLTREWLDQQASAGLLTYEPSSDTYRLPPAVATALADPGSPFWMAGGLVGMQALYLDLDRGIDAMRSDGALGWGEHHHYFFEGTEELFRPAYDHFLIQQWMPAMSSGIDPLNAGIAVADIGCGNGASTIRMARAFPESSFTGFDFHTPSVEAARKTATELGLDNVSFEVATADGYSGPFDLICFFDCLHDMGDPVGAATHARSQLAADGHVILVEPFAKDSRAENHGFMAALRYGMSLFGCVPCSLAQDGAAGLGNQAGEAGMRTIFEASGFSMFARIAETPNNIVYEAAP